MGIMVGVGLLCDVHRVTSGAIEIGLDGEEAMKSVFAEWDPKPENADYDLILDIRRKLAKLPITATGRHVEGHQDDPRKRKGPPKPLDRWAKLNVAMDARAKKLLRQRLGLHYPNIPFGEEHLVVKFRGKKLSKIDIEALYEDIYGDKTKAHWAARHDIPANRVDCIHWEAQGKAI